MAERVKLFIAAIVVLSSLAGVAVLDGYGKRSRRVALLPDRGVVTVVSNPLEAVTVWRTQGLHGVTLVALAHRLYFAEPDDESLIHAMTTPYRIDNLARRAEAAGTVDNFMVLCLRTGIARRIVHLVSPRQYGEMAVAAQEEEGARITEQAISLPYFGSPRVIATALPPLADEAVALFVDAPFFRDHDPAATVAQLRRHRILSVVAVARETGSGIEGERLTQFLRLVESGHVP